MDAIASQITSLTIVYSIVYSDADQRKHQSSASLAIVRRIHRGPVNSPHKWPVTRKMFPFDDVIMPPSLHQVVLSGRFCLRWLGIGLLTQNKQIFKTHLCGDVWVIRRTILPPYWRLIDCSPSAVYMRRWTEWSLVQVMACHLFVAMPLPEPMPTYCQFGPRGTNFIQGNVLENVVYDWWPFCSRSY